MVFGTKKRLTVRGVGLGTEVGEWTEWRAAPP
jgi:hypothetical protein